MQSPCIREVSKTCFHGCCPTPFLGLPEPHTQTPNPIGSGSTFRHDFITAMASSLYPNAQFTNHESLPSLEQSLSNLIKAHPQYSQTDQADQIRAHEYYHLSLSNHICLDYIGHGLFSYSQQQIHHSTASIAATSSIASTSSSPPPPPTLHSNVSDVPFFNIAYKSVNLDSQIRYGVQESEFESIIRKRIMRFMNISEDDYFMVFTANQSSAFKLLSDSYPFQSNRSLLTVYDYENEAVEEMIDRSEKKGARVMSAEFSWPNMRIYSRKLRPMVVSKRKTKKRGLFVFPLQSKMTGARYSYLWMSIAQEHGWHVLLDACALGPKDMETLGLTLFQPDFLICSFYKVFGENPSGFGCLFVKKSSASVLTNPTTSIGIVSLVPATPTSTETKQQTLGVPLSSSTSTFIQQKNKETPEIQEIEELSMFQSTDIETHNTESSEIEFKGLDDADSLGLVLISSRVRYLVNWLINALMSLHHPHSENGFPLVKIYGPNIKFDRGPAVAFNIFDWKGEKIEPILVQKLADRNNISLSFGFLQHIWFSDKYDEVRERVLETKSIEEKVMVGNKKREKFNVGVSVISVSLGFLTNFEDIYRLWAFISRFLDADYVEKERWRYMALNRTTVEV